MAERRATPRGTPDRRVNRAASEAMPQRDNQVDDLKNELH